jgi:hypothetical protein
MNLPGDVLAHINSYGVEEPHVLMNRNNSSYVQSRFYGEMINQIAKYEEVSRIDLIHRIFPLIDGCDFQYDTIEIVKALFSEQVNTLRSIGSQGESAFQRLLLGPKSMTFEKYRAIKKERNKAQVSEDYGLVKTIPSITQINDRLRLLPEINLERDVIFKAQKIRAWINSVEGRGVIATMTQLCMYGRSVFILPPEIEEFTQLIELNLCRVYFNTLPETIGNLSQLTLLVLSLRDLTAPKSLCKSMQVDRFILTTLIEQFY